MFLSMYPLSFETESIANGLRRFPLVLPVTDERPTWVCFTVRRTLHEPSMLGAGDFGARRHTVVRELVLDNSV